MFSDIQVQLYFARRASAKFGYTFPPLAIFAASLPAAVFLAHGAVLVGALLAVGTAYFRSDSVALAGVPAYLRPRVLNFIRMRFEFLSTLGGVDRAAGYLRDIDDILEQFWKAVDAGVSAQTLQKILNEIDDMFGQLAGKVRSEMSAKDQEHYAAVLSAKNAIVKELRGDQAAEQEVDQLLNRKQP
jgi:hypothetical protein